MWHIRRSSRTIASIILVALWEDAYLSLKMVKSAFTTLINDFMILSQFLDDNDDGSCHTSLLKFHDDIYIDRIGLTSAIACIAVRVMYICDICFV